MCLRDIENADDYAEYEARVQRFWDREGITNLSQLPSEDEYGERIPDRNLEGEAYFSWRPCCVCERYLGGDRYDCHGYNPTINKIQEYDGVCSDCLYYAEHGQLDDTTMMRVEKTRTPAPLQDEDYGH